MIAVALSGGVDSSLAASLLLEAGHKVVGLFMDLGLGRPAPVEVAEQLGVRLKVVDLQDRFQVNVVQPWLAAYAAGLTPNPCPWCNRRVKFAALLAEAEKEGAEALATGHYARLDSSLDPPAIRRGADLAKEQSYFLARLDRAWLKRLVFPLGGLTKPEVRVMARQRGLVAADRPESQDVCFLDQDYRSFFRRHHAPQPGEVVDLSGRVLGRHQGLFAYTVGQRRGLGLPATEPYYVLALDKARNRVVVGPQCALYKAKALVGEVNWLVRPESRPGQAEVQVRYRMRPVLARLEDLGGDRVELDFSEPVRAVAPGQLAAFYHGDVLLGGGTIAPETTEP